MPRITSAPGFKGSDKTFKVSTLLVSLSNAQKSVNVPPISTPTRYVMRVPYFFVVQACIYIVNLALDLDHKS